MVRSKFRDFDWTLLGFVLVLSVISVLEIRSATAMTKFHGFQTKQIIFLCIGTVLMFGMSLIDYHRLLDIAYVAYGISVGLLVAVLIPHIGQKVLGARRWINFGGGFHFQPSEWVKLVLIVAMARFLWGRAGEGKELSWKDIGKACALILIPMALVLKQPDLGTGLTYFPVLAVGMFLGGMRWKQAGIILLGLLVVLGIGFAAGKRLKPYQQKRIDAFLNPDSDPKGSGYQIKQSLIAVGSGGVWGQGANKGSQTQGDFLPIPYTDFIFAAFCEEHGFVGATFVLVLYFLILVRLIQNAQMASDPPGTLLVMGAVGIMIFQIAINIGMCIGLMPVTGIPLPLMSYGGSSILFTFLSLGIVMNVRMKRFVN
ncbi:MAG: rod shape-determining protein RodA [Acidobacteriaceae bacterium]|nr:rod shape-determining protein RodA [Acidobacteriaceae bacterium]